MIQAIPPIYRNPLIANSAGVEAGQTQVADRLLQGTLLKEAERQEIRKHEDLGSAPRGTDEAVKHLEPGFHPVVEELPDNPNHDEQKKKQRRQTHTNAGEAEQTVESSKEASLLTAREPIGASLTIGNQEQLRAVAREVYLHNTFQKVVDSGHKVDTSG